MEARFKTVTVCSLESHCRRWKQEENMLCYMKKKNLFSLMVTSV